MFETDDDDFMPSSSTNLSSIFDGSMQLDIPNLSYKAPKQPKIVGDPPSLADLPEQISENKVQRQIQSSVILAKLITLWKLDNGQNKSLGKHIVAIIGNMHQNIYELIVYKEKSNILIKQLVNETLNLFKYPNNFIGIFDSERQFWSIHFDNLENVESFLKELSSHNCQIVEQKLSNSTEDQEFISRHNSARSECHMESKNMNLSINEPNQITVNSSKDKILSRITKVGQQIVPKTAIEGGIEGKTSTEASDSETDFHHSRVFKPNPKPKFRQNTNREEAICTPIMSESNILHNSFNQIVANNNRMVQFTPQPYSEYGINNFIIAQNNELKANLAEINLKLAGVILSKCEIGEGDKNGTRLTKQQECDNLKSKIKCLNLKIENLQTDLGKLNGLFEDLKKKFELKCLEVEIQKQEQQKKEKEYLKNITKEINRLKEEHDHVETLKALNEQLNVSIREKEEKIIEIRRDHLKEYDVKEEHILRENFEREISQLNLKINGLTYKTKEYEERLEQNDEINLNKLQHNDLILKKEKLNKKIKEIMNETFRNIMENFDENEHYNFRNIQPVILGNLKKTTYNFINAIKE